MENRGHLPQFTNRELRLQISDKLAQIEAPRLLVVRPALYLAQMHQMASEYQALAKKLVTHSYAYSHEVLADILLLREVAKILSHHVQVFIESYEELALFFPDEEEYHPPDINPPSGMSPIHRQHFPAFCIRLQKIGCSDLTSAKFAEDMLGLWWELRLLSKRVETLVTQEHQVADIATIVSDIAAPWTETLWHAIFHLGEYEQLYNPGVLGWSLVVLSEIRIDLDVDFTMPDDS